MKKSDKSYYLTVGILFAVYTMAVFLIPFPKTFPFFLAYLFSLTAFSLQVYAYKLAFRNGEGVKSKFYGYPIARVGWIYLAAQLVLSIVLMAAGGFFPVWLTVLLELLILAAALVGLITTDNVRDEITRQDERLKKDVSRMRAMQAKANSLVGQCSDPTAKAALQKVADALRYSDPVSSEATQQVESDLKACLDELQRALTDGDYNSVATLCEKFLPRLVERNQMEKWAKS